MSNKIITNGNVLQQTIKIIITTTSIKMTSIVGPMDCVDMMARIVEDNSRDIKKKLLSTTEWEVVTKIANHVMIVDGVRQSLKKH